MADQRAKAKKKTGRPPKYPGEGPRPTVTVRVRGRLRDQLQQEAASSELSISEAIERRLEQSFHSETMEQLTAVLWKLAERVQRLEARDRATQMALLAVVKVFGESDQPNLPAYVAALDASIKGARMVNGPAEVIEYYQQLRAVLEGKQKDTQPSPTRSRTEGDPEDPEWNGRKHAQRMADLVNARPSETRDLTPEDEG